MLYLVTSAIQNNHLEPDSALIKFLENKIDGETILISLQASLQQANMQFFFRFYYLNERPGRNSKSKPNKVRSARRERVDSPLTLQNRKPLQILGWTEWDVKWKLTWNNFMLSMASINTNDDDEEGFSVDRSMMYSRKKCMLVSF